MLPLRSMPRRAGPELLLGPAEVIIVTWETIKFLNLQNSSSGPGRGKITIRLVKERMKAMKIAVYIIKMGKAVLNHLF